MLKPFRTDSKLGRRILSYIQKCHHEDYWRRRSAVVDPANSTPTIVKLWWLLHLKRTDSYHGCSFGTNIHAGASFKTPPHLPHGPAGIFVGHDVSVGSGVVIFQQVTIAHGGVHIGDNVVLGAGSKILPGCKIGNGAKIGANCVVIEDIPEGATVVLPRPRIILKDRAEQPVISD